MKINGLNLLTHIALQGMALQFNLRPSLGKYLKSSDGWTNFTIGLRTASGKVNQAIVFSNGRVSVKGQIPDGADAVMHFVNDGVLRQTIRITPNEMLNLVLKNKIILYGNMAYLQAFALQEQFIIEHTTRVTGLIHGSYKAIKNFRGGDYTVGFWSVAQHVAYGTLSGALPSGKLAHKPFTPGVTPHPSASENFLDNIRDVAGLNPHHMDNNIAFNVKLVPSAKDSREKTVNTMAAYVKSYFEQGGMQIQFNMVNSQVLKDAMANPGDYQNLLVRISGYNAYFVNLNREMQLELIERTEYRL